MKKLTLVLVALLLALACVFVACGKKNETPADTNTDKPVDDNPAVVVEPTVAKEDLVKIAEDFKDAYAENYVGLYTAEVETAIEAAKSEALLNIQSAESKDEAEKIANDFIDFLKAQPTVVDSLEALIDEIGEVALADADAVNELTAYYNKLESAFSGNNAAKKAILDAYKDDAETRKEIATIITRFATLKTAKAAADAKNAENDQIAALLKNFTAEKKSFTLADVKAYKVVVDNVANRAKTYEIAETEAAYTEIFNVATLAQAKEILDTAIAKDATMVAMQAVVNAADALQAAVAKAQYREYIDADVTDSKAAKDTVGGYIVPVIDVDDGNAIKWVKTTPAETATKVKNYEISIITRDGKNYYKLALKADVDAAVKAKNDLFNLHTADELANDYGYDKTQTDTDEIVGQSVKAIGAYAAAFTTSLNQAKSDYAGTWFAVSTAYVDADKVPAAKTSTGTYALTTTLVAKVSTNVSKLIAEIDEVKGTFKKYSGDKLIADASGDYIAAGTYKLDATHYVDLVDEVPTITFKAYNYTYKLGDKVLGTEVTAAAYNLLALVNADGGKAEATADFLAKYIGEGTYADKYDLTTDYGFAAGSIMYMTDRAVEEVVTPVVAQIKGVAVSKEQAPVDAAVSVKVVSPYAISNAVAAELAKIEAAKKDAVAELKADVLALTAAGEADAISALVARYGKVADGEYVITKLYGADAASYKALAAQSIAAEKITITYTDAEGKEQKYEPTVLAFLTAAGTVDAYARNLKIYKDVATALAIPTTNLSTAAANVQANDEAIAKFDAYIEAAQAAYDAAKLGEKVNIVNAEGDSNNTISTDALKALNYLNTLKGLFTDKATFTANADATLKGYVANTTAARAFLTKFDGVDGDSSATMTLAARLVAIYDGSVQDGENLAKTLDAAQKAYDTAVKTYDEAPAMNAEGAYGDKAAIAALKSAIEAFATAQHVDFLNLKISRTYGEKTVTFDALTEAYKLTVIGARYAVIQAVLTAAGDSTFGADASAAIAGAKWETTATNRVNARAIDFATVTSISAAKKAVADTKPVESDYAFATAASLIDAVAGATCADAAALKTAIGY